MGNLSELDAVLAIARRGKFRLRVRLPNGAIYRWPFEKDGHSVLIDVDGPVTLDQATLARSAVLSSIGLTLAMQSDVRADIEAGRLEQVLEDWAPVMAPLCLYYQVGVTRPQPSRRSSTLPVGWVVRAPAEWPAADIDL
ncbi:MAG TPA: LysR substrate-binding domain-containing protein [Hyphomicrobium sp.]|nr:LysR substrate-binding domain-containing protein [Hyphomicrobium sp.]